jgi:hypothetical protein
MGELGELDAALFCVRIDEFRELNMKMLARRRM